MTRKRILIMDDDVPAVCPLKASRERPGRLTVDQRRRKALFTSGYIAEARGKHGMSTRDTQLQS